MATAEEYRAFARACMQRAERAKELDHRGALLDMAASWAEAAALLDHQHALLSQFGEAVSDAKRHVLAVGGVLAIDGNGRSREMGNNGQAGPDDGVSIAEHERQPPRDRGKISAD